MNDDYQEFWRFVPKNADHPLRVPILEAFRWIGEPLTAIGLVDVFDGQNLTMWEAAHHLRVLETLHVLEPDPAETRRGVSRYSLFYVPYRLRTWKPDEGR